MIYSKFIRYLTIEEGVGYSLYPSPVGPIYILGDDSSLKALIFKNSKTVDYSIETIFPKRGTSEIKAAAMFLNRYFDAKQGKVAISTAAEYVKYPRSPDESGRGIFSHNVLRAPTPEQSSGVHRLSFGKSGRAAIKNSIIRLRCGTHVFQLDLSEFSQKEIRVYLELMKIPSGRTISYNALSKRAGIPQGARFVGNAMAKNAFPIIIPCHRVIKNDGTAGNYSGGVGIKDFLLKHEGAVTGDGA